MTSAAHRILVVDDEEMIRDSIVEYLDDNGYQAVGAAHGQEALDKLAAAGDPLPCLILLDLMMPIMDGYGFLDERSKDPGLASIPLAIVTAGHGVDHDRLGDALHIIRKPFDVSRMVGILHTLGSGGSRPA